MKKLSKNCHIDIYTQKTGVLTENNFYHGPSVSIAGDKNGIMSYLRKCLIKDHAFTGKLLTDTLNAINKTSNACKGCGEGVCETIVHAFNPETGTLYTFKIKYFLERLSNLPERHRINNRGENLREKRLIQLHGGGNLGRYRLAIKNANTKKLLELLSPMINVQFGNATSIRFSEDNEFKIDYPGSLEFKPNDDLIIRINLNQYWSTVSVDIVYKGCPVNLLNNRHKDITDEKIKEALKVADQFDEICAIIKKSYSL